MSSAKTQLAVAPNVPNLAAPQAQKEYSAEDSLNRQNSLGNSRRGNMKGKHLTRSLAMRESTSPPRTPTPRNEQLSSPNGQATNSYNNSSQHQHQHHYQQQQQQQNDTNEHSNNSSHSLNSNNIPNNSNSNSTNNNNNKMHIQSTVATSTSSPLLETPSVVVTSQHSQQQPLQSQQQQQQQQPHHQQHQQKQNVVICSEADFPKLTPPKSSKSPRTNHNNNNSNNSSNLNHRDVGDKNNIVASGDHNNTKAEFSNSANNSSSSSKKSSSENNNKASNNAHINSNKNLQPYSSATGANAMQLALNVADPPMKQQHPPSAPMCGSGGSLYNSSMNYQLKPDVTQQQQQQQQQQHCGSNNMYEKENRCPRNDSQNSSNSMSHEEGQNHVSDNNHYERGGGATTGPNNVGPMLGNSLGGGGGGPKKHRTTSNSKCTKPRLKTMGSSSSMDGGNSNSTSGFISRDSSMEQFTDQSGIDLLTFFKETLNKNPKDRNTLMEIEKDLIELAQDKTRSEIRFPAASSYNRMLIHRTAAFFGMEHNVDTKTQQCVIVATTKGTRIPEIRFKTLFRDRMSDEPRKSILKRDTHSFDDPRHGGYLCPDRGMLDRKAKSFEEREEDYEKARRRIFRNQQQQQQQQQAENAECEESYLSWSSSVEQQQQHTRMRSNGKMLKSQNSTETRDGRPGGVSKANSYGNYGVPPPTGGPPLPRTDSNKSSSRSYSKQDSMGSSNTPWRLSPSSSGSIYHFDPSNLPPSQAITPGVYGQNGAPSNHTSYAAPVQQQQQQQQQQQHQQQQQQHQQHPQQHANGKKCKQQQQPNRNATTEYSVGTMAKCSPETCAETSTQTVEVNGPQTVVNESSSPREMLNIQEEGEEDSSVANETDECDNSASNCLSVTTTTSTKSFDRIEIQKFKNQATSPNIPITHEETEETTASHDGTVSRDQAPRNQYQSQTSTFVPQQRDTPNSARSTPYSSVESNAKRASEEPKATPWTYTQSYQAPDGSTVFHTTNGNPYCTATTYQQGPDGSVYAIPQSMVYTYPSQIDGEVQGYFMPVFDPANQRPEATGIIPASTQTIYPAAGGGTAVVPVATAYPSAQFAATTGTPIYPGQVVYSTEQFPGSGGAQVAGGAAVANGPNTLQQYPVTATYPIGYPYPYNGYWGQTMTTYYVPQQALTNATPLLPAPPPAASAVAGSHLTGGAVNAGAAPLTNNLMITTTAAGPPSSTLPSANHNVPGSGSYHHHGGVYNGGNMAGRAKRTTPPHSHGTANSAHPQSNHHHPQPVATTPAGITTTYQLGHAVPTFALATSANASAAAAAVAATNGDFGGPNTGAATTMYAIPQHAAATMFPTNLLPYATGASQGAPGPMLAPVAAQHHAAASHHSAAAAAGAAVAHAHQANTVISPLFSHPPQQLFAAQHTAGTVHAPGPSAIAIVDPATVSHSVASSNHQSGNNAGGSSNYVGSSTPSAPSTPHSLPAQTQHRNPPLFTTPPVSGPTGGVSYHYYAASNDTSNYSGNSNSSHSYASAYDKRNSGAAAGKKQSTYSSSNGNNGNTTFAARQNSTANYASHSNKSLLHGANDARSSPNAAVSVSSNYQGNRPHAMHKRSNEKSSSSNALLNGPPMTAYHNPAPNSSGNNNSATIEQSNKTSGSARMNSGGGGYRQKPSSFDLRRNGSQRNSPNTNSSNESNNNSPSSLVSSPPSAATYSTTYVNSAGIEVQQQQQQPPSSLFIARGQHIPPSMVPPPHVVAGVPPSAGGPPPPGTHPAAAAAVLGGVAAEVANAAAAAAAVASGHQPLLGTYNPGAPTGVYIKYGQTYFTHPTVALPNSRRSPQSDLRPPQMAPMPGMYPAVNMMLSAHQTRPVQPRHPNSNYKYARPSR